MWILTSARGCISLLLIVVSRVIFHCARAPGAAGQVAAQPIPVALRLRETRFPVRGRRAPRRAGLRRAGRARVEAVVARLPLTDRNTKSGGTDVQRATLRRPSDG